MKLFFAIAEHDPICSTIQIGSDRQKFTISETDRRHALLNRDYAPSFFAICASNLDCAKILLFRRLNNVPVKFNGLQIEGDVDKIDVVSFEHLCKNVHIVR